MSAHVHLPRAPWYVPEREIADGRVPAPGRPALQKYDRPDFVDQVLADPRRSLEFVPKEDDWSFPVRAQPAGKGRERLATHRMVPTGVRKLFQPNHDRFYAVVAELVCDQPGLPVPGRPPGIRMGFVLRRERFELRTTDPKQHAADQLVLRQVGKELAAALTARAAVTPKDPADADPDDLDDVVEGADLSDDQRKRLAEIGLHRVVERWVGDAVSGKWEVVADDPSDEAPVPGREHVRPMWAIPPPEDACGPARHRSLWFAPVPTLTGAHDAAGAPQLDDRHTYRIVCLARPIVDPPAHCPPRIGWSEPSEPFRLAAFADPAGTRNRRTTIVMPDFRALAAQAGQPPGPGGVEIVRPPGSQLKFTAGADGTPTGPDPLDLGASTSRCTFALELLMIVAMFLFSLFLPVVVLLFQLWWMLLLRFCLPPPGVSLSLLEAHVEAGGTIASLPLPPPPQTRPDPPTAPDRKVLDEMFGVSGIGDGLAQSEFAGEKDALAGLLDAVGKPPTPAVPPTVLEGPDDPLCDPPRRAVS